jgi:hypothetical protein
MLHRTESQSSIYYYEDSLTALLAKPYTHALKHTLELDIDKYQASNEHDISIKDRSRAEKIYLERQ